MARAIHGESPRRSGPFVAVHCAALPQELLEAELSGYREGAFTGADSDRPGLLESARGGSVLFDEIAEMPPAIQAKVLRFLERGRMRPLGGTDEVDVDVRYLFTTNMDPRALMEKGSLRRERAVHGGRARHHREGALQAAPPARDPDERSPLSEPLQEATVRGRYRVHPLRGPYQMSSPSLRVKDSGPPTAIRTASRRACQNVKRRA